MTVPKTRAKLAAVVLLRLSGIAVIACALGTASFTCSSNPSAGGGAPAVATDAGSEVPTSSQADAGNWIEGGAAQADDDAAATGDDAAADDALEASFGGCTTVAPTECPLPMPSYANDVAPILQAKCNGCHTGALNEPWALTNFADVQAWAVSLLGDLVNCTMPPADGGTPALSKAETDALTGWIVCGAPNN